MKAVCCESSHRKGMLGKSGRRRVLQRKQLVQRLGSERYRTKLMENRKQFHLVGTWSADCWGEEGSGCGEKDGCRVNGDQIMEIF